MNINKVELANTNQWQQGQVIDLEITDLSNSGDGVGRWQGRVVFVPNTVTGDQGKVRLMRVKSQYAQGKLEELKTPSIHRIRPRCIVADKCGGCQWQHIKDEYQHIAKQEQVIQTLQRIGGLENLPIDPILFGNSSLEYRNKVTYPLARSTTGQVQAGYYRQGSHRLVNLNQCPVQDARLNTFLAEIKLDLYERGWSIYNEKKHQGKLRHLGLRIGRKTGEILLTLVTTDWELSGIEEQGEIWLEKYPELVGVALNFNSEQTNTIFGQETRCIAGQFYLREMFAGLEFRLRPDTFFQVNTEVAEALLGRMVEHLNLQGNETVVDAYCGIGTFTLPVAKQVKQVIGLEVQAASIEQAKINAQINHINNVSFEVGTVESLLPELNIIPDIIILDPPRKGCDSLVIETLLKIQPQQILYISCDPATLARDIKALCQAGNYQLVKVQAADFFPQTAHVECAVLLSKQSVIDNRQLLIDN